MFGIGMEEFGTRVIHRLKGSPNEKGAFSTGRECKIHTAGF